MEFEKILLRFGDLYLIYNDKEEAYIENELVEIGEGKKLKRKIRIRDTYKEQQNNSIVGTTLVNLLNKSQSIKELINRYLNYLNQYDSETINQIVEDENMPFSYFLLNIVTELQDKLTKQIKCFPIETIIYNQFENLKKDYNEIVFQNYDLYKYLDTCKENRSKCKYFDEMYSYLSKIINRTLKRSEWFKDFSEREMIIIFLKSIIGDIDFITTNCEKEIDIFPPEAKREKCKIETLTDLFYASKYHIHLKKKNKLKKCENCNKYFITKNTSIEIYCRRKYKNNKYTCCEYRSKNYRSVDRKKMKDNLNLRQNISNEKNKIRTRLGRRDKINSTTQKAEFNKLLENTILEINKLEFDEDTKLNMQLKWLQEKSKEYDKNKHNL